MATENIEWLLKGPIWLKYAVEKQFLGMSPDVKPVLADPAIQRVIERLKDKREGIPAIPGGLMDADRYENPYWDLFFLADLGLTAAELSIQSEIERFLETQAADGTYMTEMGMQPAYFCKSMILLSAIARMGYQNDVHIQKLIQLFLKKQRLDGGWYCNPNHDVGSALQDEPSCPQENLNILLLFGQYPQYRSDQRFKGAIDQLLRHWEIRDRGIQIVYFGVGKRYQSLQYPVTRYGIVRVLDALSLFPYALQQSTFRNMLGFVQHKAKDGCFAVETHTPYTQLEPQESCNRLLTFIIRRIEKRLEASY
jgi:hypothetical protein